MASKNFSYDDFLQFASVSRETYAKLQHYVELLEKWQKTINLIGPMTARDIWNRHIIDSSQILSHIEPMERMVDLGTGAGFPGLILAIMGKQHITLVESDSRKSAFLKEAARVTDADVEILTKRAEDVDMTAYDVITARAFAPLAALLNMIGKTLKGSHKLLLLKGKRYMDELVEARKARSFDYQAFPSVSDSEGVILSLKNFKPVSVV